MTTEDKTVMICAGGTGGHMFPALALAEDLQARGCRILLVTDHRAARYADGHEGLTLCVIASAALSGGIVSKIKGVFRLVLGYCQSVRLINRHRPDLVVGFGGYPSLPPMVAAQRRNIPTVIHEQNAVLGKANAYLASKAIRIALSLPNKTSIADQDIARVVVTGNPVRQDIAALYTHPYTAPEAEPFHLLVMGGSLGASVMARQVPQALKLLPDPLKSRLHVTQQCRKGDLETVAGDYKNMGIHADLKPFFDDIPVIYKKTDLVIARAGASTVAEVAIAGIPAIYIPYPHHADQQQKVNAETIAAKGGAWVIEEKDLTPQKLADRLTDLMTTPETLFKAAEAARAQARPEATRKLGNLVIALLKGWQSGY